MLYLICAMFSLIRKCPISLMIYPLPCVGCLTHSMMCLKIHVVCFNSFITWVKIALCVDVLLHAVGYIIQANSCVACMVWAVSLFDLKHLNKGFKVQKTL